MKLSILIPVYNERAVVERSLSQVLGAPLPENMRRELVIVDDCSTDGTSAILERFAARHPEIVLVRHTVNQGKGAAVRTAIAHAQSDFCLIQDADLEYDPSEYPTLLRPLLDGRADAVFGSRYLASPQRRVLPYWHTNINRVLTTLSNIFSNLHVTDMETCYKVFRTDLLKSIPIRSNRFGIEPELTMKCAKRKLRIYEVPISYHGRTYEEGKKIGWRDGLKALGVILKFWLIDDLYAQPYGRAYLNNLSGTPQYLNWITRLLRPHLGDRVIEVGAGIGNIAGRLMAKRLHYLVCERDPLYLHALRNRFLRTPNVQVLPLDPAVPMDYAQAGAGFDTAVCLNVLEYLERPEETLHCLHQVLAQGGNLIVLAPNGPGLHGSLDRTLGHHQRFDSARLRRLLEGTGFAVETVFTINKIGRPVWWLHSKLLGASQLTKLSLKVFDKTVWLWRRLDTVLPWEGLSLVAIARRA
ncbi:MAG: glycosyltransferase [Acidobacteria bacterium]|nr:glycosyltransferase [Acidobacteriota bacterium]